MRIVATFYPLKVFVSSALGVFVLTIIWTVRTMNLTGQVSALGTMLMIVSAFLFLFGPLADQVASIRLEIGRITRRRGSD